MCLIRCNFRHIVFSDPPTALMQEVKTLGYDMFIEANCERLTDKIKKCEQIVMVKCKEQVISTGEPVFTGFNM